MTAQQIAQLSRQAAWDAGFPTWCQWLSAQTGEYATKELATAAATKMNSDRVRTEFTCGVSANSNGGWDVCSYGSSD